MRKILVLVAALFLLSGCEHNTWKTNFHKDFRWHITICCGDMYFLVNEYKIVKNAEKTHLIMRDGLIFAQYGHIRGIQFSRLAAVITPSNTVSIHELSKEK